MPALAPLAPIQARHIECIAARGASVDTMTKAPLMKILMFVFVVSLT